MRQHHRRHGDHGCQVATQIHRSDHPGDRLLAQLPKCLVFREILQALRGHIAPEVPQQLIRKNRLKEKKHHKSF